MSKFEDKVHEPEMYETGRSYNIKIKKDFLRRWLKLRKIQGEEDWVLKGLGCDIVERWFLKRIGM